MNSAKTRIREMDTRDVQTVTLIEQTVSANPWNEKIFLDCLAVGYHCYVMELDEVVVGFAIIGVAVEECHIFNIAIQQEYQHQGLGKQLMRYLLIMARLKGAKHAFLEVRVSNLPAIKLYRQLGFLEIGQRKNYYLTHAGQEDALVFSLVLEKNRYGA